MAEAWEADAAGYGVLWAGFDEQFHFRPGITPITWPAIMEPTPSVTVDLSPIFTVDPPRFASGAQAVDALALRAMTAAFSDGERLVVLDWQHTSYRFAPHVQAVSREPWRTRPFPNGDYHIFLAEDMGVGFFGHPWEQTLCIFGEPMLRELAGSLTSWLPVKRSKP